MSLESLLKLVPASGRLPTGSVGRALNALGPWREAAEMFDVPTDENGVWTALVYASQISALRLLPAHCKFALGVLDRNAACLNAFDRGIERGQLQFPEVRSIEQVTAETEFASRLGEIARLYLIRFRLAFADGELVAAAEELFCLEKIGDLICNGEGQMLHFLIGLWLRAAAVRGFGHVATNVNAPSGLLVRIVEALDDALKSPDGLAQSLRVDLTTIELARLDRTIDDEDLPQVLDQLLEVYYRPQRNTAAKVPGSDHAAIADEWLEETREHLLFLLDGHPRPLDKTATARLMGQIVAETIRDLEPANRPGFLDVVGQLHSMRRKLRLFRLAQKTRYWPAELTPGVEIDASGGMGMKPPVDDEVVAIRLPAEGFAGGLNEIHLEDCAEQVAADRKPDRADADRAAHGLRLRSALAGPSQHRARMRRLMKQRLAGKS